MIPVRTTASTDGISSILGYPPFRMTFWVCTQLAGLLGSSVGLLAMNPQEAATQSTKVISGTPAHFMLDPATYVRGSELGYEGFDFYVTGRAGVLGKVDSSVVSASFIYFNPDSIEQAFARSGSILEPEVAADEFAKCGHTWAENHLPDADYEQINAIATVLVDAQSPSIAPLFAGWRAMRRPESPKSLTLHLLNTLRELRGAYHGCAVLAAGMDPVEALMIKNPYMAGIFGWSEPYSGIEPRPEMWANAEEMTNQMMGRVFENVDEKTRSTFVEILEPLPGLPQ